MSLLERYPFIRCPNCLGELMARSDILSCDACRIDYGVQEGTPILCVESEQIENNMNAIQRARTYRVDWSRLARTNPRKALLSREYDAFNDDIRSLFDTKGFFLDIGLNPKTYFYDLYSKELSAVDLVRLDLDPSKHPDICGDLYLLPISDNSIGCITCLSVLEHVPNPFAAVEEMHRVLSPNGLLYIWVPWLWLHHDPLDCFRFSHQAFDSLLHMFSNVTVYFGHGGLLNSIRGLLEPLHHSGESRRGLSEFMSTLEEQLKGPLNHNYQWDNPAGHAVMARK